MTRGAYYNEFDPHAAAWLRELIKEGHIADGEVDERDIRDVCPNDIRSFQQVHWFAGIGGWSLALRLAGWPDDRRIWTASCPCQPFSAAGKGEGFADERHLWPSLFHHIECCRPSCILGEQVASKDGLTWLDLVFADLEGALYAAWAADLCAAGVGAPHIRQRLFFVAHAAEPRRRGQPIGHAGAHGRPAAEPRRLRDAGRLSDSSSRGCGELGLPSQSGCSGLDDAAIARHVGPVENAEGNPRDEARLRMPSEGCRSNHWSDIVWLPCRDGKARPTQPGIFPLVVGVSDALARLRALEIGAWQKVVAYADEQKRKPSQVLRELRAFIRATARRQETHAGVESELPQEALLLAFLFCAASARDRAAFGCRITEARTQNRRRIVRGMRADGGNKSASCRWQSDEQRPEQYSASLRELSCILARDAQTYRAATRDAHASSNRTVILRGAGNAISPPIAAAFVEAVMEDV